MTEKQHINGRDVWIRIDTHPLKRPHSNIIPTEYFSAVWFTRNPALYNDEGQPVNDSKGYLRLFESPMAALEVAAREIEKLPAENAG